MEVDTEKVSGTFLRSSIGATHPTLCPGTNCRDGQIATNANQAAPFATKARKADTINHVQWLDTHYPLA